MLIFVASGCYGNVKSVNKKDEGRTAKHERVIYCLKLPSRYLGQEGVDVSWFDSIEDNRKQIGDFACYIAYIYSINAR